MYPQKYTVGEGTPKSGAHRCSTNANTSWDFIIQGKEDGVTPAAMSENVHEKFTGPFERILLQNVGHFPQREDSDAVSRELAVFLKG